MGRVGHGCLWDPLDNAFSFSFFYFLFFIFLTNGGDNGGLKWTKADVSGIFLVYLGATYELLMTWQFLIGYFYIIDLVL